MQGTIRTTHLSNCGEYRAKCGEIDERLDRLTRAPSEQQMDDAVRRFGSTPLDGTDDRGMTAEEATAAFGVEYSQTFGVAADGSIVPGPKKKGEANRAPNSVDRLPGAKAYGYGHTHTLDGRFSRHDIKEALRNSTIDRPFFYYVIAPRSEGNMIHVFDPRTQKIYRVHR